MQVAMWPLVSQVANSWPVSGIQSFTSRLAGLTHRTRSSIIEPKAPEHCNVQYHTLLSAIPPSKLYSRTHHHNTIVGSLKPVSAQSIVFPFLRSPRPESSRTFLSPILRSRSYSVLSPRTSSPPINRSLIRYASVRSILGQPTAATGLEVRILEHKVSEDPDNVEKNVELFKALASTKHIYSWEAIINRWERMCELNPKSPLLHSDACFAVYLKALVATNQIASVTPAVKRREILIASHPPQATLATDTAPATAPSSSQLIANEILDKAPRAKAGWKSVWSRFVWGDKAGVTEGDKQAEPLRVTIEESRGSMAWRAVRFVLVTVLVGFAFLTVLSLMLENSGLMKAGPNQKEWEATDKKPTKFSDVHGVDEAKEDLEEVVEFLRDPSRFNSLGGRLPKGVLLVGPPGTGKTLLAKAVAGEAGVPFFFASGSEFDEIFVGTGAKRVRELFAAARKKQPAIIFIDELDAIGSKRSAKDQHYMKQTLNQLLVEMDGFKESDGIILIAATNFPQSLDPALVRPGRFDKKVTVPLPDMKGRTQILIHHMRDIMSDIAADPTIIARGTIGFSGADLQNLVNQAAIQASREGAKRVQLKHFEWARDKILMGAERKSAVISEKEKRMTAYHEGGHALVALFTPGATPLHKVTCMPRGNALGVTQSLPTEDRVSMSFQEYCATMDVSMGGRVAEEIIYGKENITSGASSDLKNATNVATAMVRYYGYSDKLGPVHLGDNTSPQMRGLIDNEVRRMLEESVARARKLLEEHKEDLHKLTDALVEYETLDRAEVEAVLKGEKIRQDDHELEDIRKELGLPEPSPEDIEAITKPPKGLS